MLTRRTDKNEAVLHWSVSLGALVAFLGLGACGGQTDSNSIEREPPSLRAAADGGPIQVVADAGMLSPDAETEETPLIDEEQEPRTFVEPVVCPEAQPRPTQYECDPWAAESGCEPTEGCFPVVIYPMSPCAVERIGAMCRPVGAGVHGESCDGGDCAAGHICVSTSRGTYCSQACAFNTGRPSECPAGLLCQPIDIDGFGACL